MEAPEQDSRYVHDVCNFDFFAKLLESGDHVTRKPVDAAIHAHVLEKRRKFRLRLRTEPRQVETCVFVVLFASACWAECTIVPATVKAISTSKERP